MATWTSDDAIAALAKLPEQTVLILDFDGTISSIAERPADARIAKVDVERLKRLAKRFATVAIVSGRPGAFLADRLELDPAHPSALRAFGRAGLDEVDGEGHLTADHTADDWLAVMEDVAARARAVAPDAFIEEKGVVVTLHWRRALGAELVLRDFATATADELGLATRPGKMSIECFPPNIATKATVVERLATGRLAAAYFGDDVGDLDGFTGLDHSDALTTLRIAVRGIGMPDELMARADLALPSPRAVLRFLGALEHALT